MRHLTVFQSLYLEKYRDPLQSADWLKLSLIMTLCACFLLSAIMPADAGGRYKYHGKHGVIYVGNDAVAAGIAGLAAGAILGSVLSHPRHYGGSVHYAPPVRHYYPRRYYAPRYRYAPPPRYPYRSRVYVAPRHPRVGTAFSPEWIAYCARKYKSFNPRTGTYLAYSGKVRMCR